MLIRIRIRVRIRIFEFGFEFELKFEFKKRRSGDPDILIASSDNAKKTLGWNNKKSIEDIISSLIKYYKIK